MGLKPILQLLSILHLIKMSEEQINSYLEKSYIFVCRIFRTSIFKKNR